MAIFAVRLSRERHEISSVALMGKFAGAVGNYNAHVVAYPEINWPQRAKEFVESLGLSFNPYVTQVPFSAIQMPICRSVQIFCLFSLMYLCSGIKWWFLIFVPTVGLVLSCWVLESLVRYLKSKTLWLLL